MSTIAYRAGIMAADSRAYGGYVTPIGRKYGKIRRLPDGTLVGVSSGTPGVGELVHEWYAAGAIAPPPFAPAELDFVMLAVRADYVTFFAKDNWLLSGPLRAEFYAIGGGREYALGAMHMGASAYQALEAACRFDPMSELPLVRMTHQIKE